MTTPKQEGYKPDDLVGEGHYSDEYKDVKFEDLLPEIQQALTNAKMAEERWEKLKAWLLQQDIPMRGEIDYHSSSRVLKQMRELEAEK